MRKYKLLKPIKGIKAGTEVYECSGDHGAAAHETNRLAIHHTSVSLKKDGSYPFTTIRTRHLKRIIDEKV